MAFKKTFTLNPAGPFDFDLTCQIFRNGDPQLKSYREGVFRQLLRVGEGLVLACVSSDTRFSQSTNPPDWT